jgi:hypothetical protein
MDIHSGGSLERRAWMWSGGGVRGVGKPASCFARSMIWFDFIKDSITVLKLEWLDASITSGKCVSQDSFVVYRGGPEGGFVVLVNQHPALHAR